MISSQTSQPCCSPLVWIHCDGPRLTQLRGDQNFPLPAISRGNGDALVARVSPVDVLVDPVDSQSFGGVQRVDERHLLWRIAGLVDVSAGWKRRKDLSVLFDLCHQKQSHQGDPSKNVTFAAICPGLLWEKLEWTILITVRSRCSLLWMMVCQGHLEAPPHLNLPQHLLGWKLLFPPAASKKRKDNYTSLVATW